MKSAIEDILFGNRTSADMKITEYEKELLSELDESETAINEGVQDEKTAAAFERFKRALDDLHLEERIDYYKAGFRFGFCLAMDVFLDESAENRKN